MLDRLKRILGISIVEGNNEQYDNWDIRSIGNIIIPEKLTDRNAFILANSVAELFFPIDFYADRISKLRFFIANKSGEEVTNTELIRFVTLINPLYSNSDLVYQYVFSLLSDGNASNYIQSPSAYSDKPLSVNNIERWDVLRPDYLTLDEYNNLSTLEIIDYASAIKRAQYCESGYTNKYLKLNSLKIHNYSSRKRNDSIIFSKSPQFAANKSIDTLLAVYSARYNVYANNGAAGYLARKSSSNTADSMQMEAIMNDIGNRQKILDDINNRNGLTGKKNIWGISGVPIEFVKTLATISELLPLDETLESSIKIAGIFQIPPVLVPRKDQSTYDNQENAEANVWENGILNMVSTVEQNLTKLFGIDKTGYVIKADVSNVSCLNQNESDLEDLKTKKLANLTTEYEKGFITYNKFLEEIGEEPITGGDKLIFDMTKTPYAVKLGVGGTQAMQAILVDQNMTQQMKKNTLIVIFGLTEQEANLITQ
jgi:hypothetical protein